MADKSYKPPEQSGFMQFFDSIFILLLVFLALYSPLILGIAGGGKVDLKFKNAAGVETAYADLAPADKTWKTLGQNPTMQAQWEKLGMTPDTAAPMISSRYDYTFNPLYLVLTAAFLIGYFLLLIAFSKREYKDVIAEKFGLR